MTIKHATVKAAGQKLFAVADWNTNHTADGVLVPNLNADLLDGLNSTDFIKIDGSSTTTALIPFAYGLSSTGTATFQLTATNFSIRSSTPASILIIDDATQTFLWSGIGGVRFSLFNVAGFVKNSAAGVLSGGNSVDISSDTNLAVSSPIKLTGDTVGFNFGTANTWTEQNTFNKSGMSIKVTAIGGNSDSGATVYYSGSTLVKGAYMQFVGGSHPTAAGNMNFNHGDYTAVSAPHSAIRLRYGENGAFTEQLVVYWNGAVDVPGNFTAGSVRSDDGITQDINITDNAGDVHHFEFNGGILISYSINP